MPSRSVFMRSVQVLALVLGMIVAGASVAGETVAWTASREEMANLLDDYNKAVRAAAIKRPNFERPLIPIDDRRQDVRVVAFRWIGATDIVNRNGRLKQELFVSLPKEIAAACKGASDPVLALQQILGLPPRTGEYVMMEFSIPTKKIFRPCASGPEISTESCSFALPDDEDVTARAETDPVFAATQAFVFRQMWSSYTRNVPDKQSYGYPFTAMGWTYNWDPKAADDYGVSEYIAEQGAPVTRLNSVSPIKYCR